MAIKLEHEWTDKWSRLPNAVVESPDLSWKAKGILLWLAGRPEGWEVNKDHLQEQATDGRSSLESGLSELREHGFLTYDGVQDEDSGQFVGTKWIIRFEVSSIQTTRDTENPRSGYQTPNKKYSTKKECTKNEQRTSSNEDDGKPSDIREILEEDPIDRGGLMGFIRSGLEKTQLAKPIRKSIENAFGQFIFKFDLNDEELKWLIENWKGDIWEECRKAENQRDVYRYMRQLFNSQIFPQMREARLWKESVGDFEDELDEFLGEDE